MVDDQDIFCIDFFPYGFPILCGIVNKMSLLIEKKKKKKMIAPFSYSVLLFSYILSLSALSHNPVLRSGDWTPILFTVMSMCGGTCKFYKVLETMRMVETIPFFIVGVLFDRMSPNLPLYQ